MVVSSRFLLGNAIHFTSDTVIEIVGTVECVSRPFYIALGSKLDNLTKLSVMISENVSVGILSLPSAVATLGMVPYVSSMWTVSPKGTFTDDSIQRCNHDCLHIRPFMVHRLCHRPVQAASS